MRKYEMKLFFEASFNIEAESKDEAFEKVIEKARLEYGSEVADFGDFTLSEGEGEGEE